MSGQSDEVVQAGVEAFKQDAPKLYAAVRADVIAERDAQLIAALEAEPEAQDHWPWGWAIDFLEKWTKEHPDG